MNAPVVFVTTEYAGLVPGGAGTVVAGLADRLMRAGRDVHVVLVTDRAGDATLLEVPATWVGQDEGAPTPFLGRSRAAAAAIAALAARGPIDRVEFHDFDGLAFTALERREELGLTRVPITVRLHGPVDLMAEAMGVAHPEWDAVRVMERESFAMADTVVVPSAGLVDTVTSRYGVDPDHVRVGEPPVGALAAVPLEPASLPELVCPGRLGEVKGSHDLVDVTVELLEEGHDFVLRFVGPDGWSVEGAQWMRPWLRSRIPPRHADRLRLEEAVPREALPGVLASAWAVVVPSRFESFCLVAHEARLLGHPVVLPDLPAFRPYFSPATGALVYPPGRAGLKEALGRILTEPELRTALAQAPPPDHGDPLDPYATPVETRHPRTQAGLATAAGKRLEAVLTAELPPGRANPVRRFAASALRHLPEPVARLAVRALPATAKDRFRQVADWRVEQERRAKAEAWRELHRRVAAGEFPPLDRPDVTVVIPCYDQGRFVEDAIASVFRQTHGSWEIVVVDDGSTDPETVAVLDRLDWPRTRLVRQENRGLPAARNAGISVARGRFVVPLDADDELAPRFVEVLSDAIGGRPRAAYAHCAARLFGDVDAIYVSRPFNPYQQLLSNGVVGCVLLRREAWEDVAGYSEDMTEGNEDWDLWLALQAAGWEQVQVHEVLFRYRKHGISMSVDTEARFESARRRMPQRHPSLYRRSAMWDLKRRHYPWVSVVVADRAGAGAVGRQRFDDLETVEGPDAVVRSRGKFVIDASDLRDADPDDLSLLAEALERDDRPIGVAPRSWGRGASPALWRRWALVDDGSPHEGVILADVALAAAPTGRLRRGVHRDPAWTVAIDTGGLPLRRQPPEVEGPFPQDLALAAVPK